MKNLVKNLINSRSLNTVLLLIGFVFIFFVSSAYSDEIKNTANINYKDVNKNPYKFTSNQTSSQRNVPGVNLVPKITSLEGDPFGEWIFPADVFNLGNADDSYNLSIASLSIGVSYEIYDDKNGNGKIDPEDILITVTSVIKPGNSFPIIIKIKDNKGLTSGSTENPIVSAISVTDSSVRSNKNLKIVILEREPDVIPTPTPTPAVNTTPQASLIKTVFPNGKVQAGDTLTYFLEFTNQNYYNIVDLNIIDNIPAALTVINPEEATNSAKANSGTAYFSTDGVNWNADLKENIRFIKVNWSSLASGNKVTFVFKAKINENSDDGSIENIANAQYKPENKDQVINTSVDTLKTNSVTSNLALNVIKNEYIINGTVYDKKTGLPKEGAKLEIYDKDGNLVGTETTGITGKFSIPVEKKGDYKIVYLDNDGKLIEQRTTGVEHPGENPAPIQIAGKVMNSLTSEIVPNAKMQVVDKSGNIILSLQTDKEGKYMITTDSLGKNIQPGSYIIKVINAMGHVTYARVDITVGPGDTILNLNILIDPFGTVYDEYGGLNSKIKGAQVKLLYNCEQPSNLVSLMDLEAGVPQKNPQITEETGFYQYFLTKEQLTNNNYCMLVHADGYQDRYLNLRAYPSRTLTGKFAVDVMDENGKIVTLSNVETVPYDVAMRPLRIFDIKKTANKSTLEIGDVVTYTVEVTNKLTFTLKKAVITDNLPFGFKYVENTLTVDGKAVNNFIAVEQLNIPLDEMKPEEKHVIIYQARTGIRVSEGASINKAQAKAISPSGKELLSEIVKATVFVKKGVFSKNGTIIGKVYIDSNNNGIQDQGESGIENAALYTSNGVRVLTDNKGKFSIPDIQDGDTILRLDMISLPKNIYLPGDAIYIVKLKNEELIKKSVSEIDLNSKNDSAYLIINTNKLKLNNYSDYNITFELKDASVISLSKNENKSFDIKDLKLEKGLNTFKVKFTDDNNKLVKLGKFSVILSSLVSIPEKEQWIGEEGVSRRVFVPESGLAKSNFRLVKVEDENAVVPEAKEKNNLTAAFVYPDKFSIKQIPYITYPDIKSHWAGRIVEYESGLEIIHGYPDGMFKPGRSISRAEITKLTLVALKSFDIKMGTNFGYILKNDSKVNIRVLNDNNQEVKLFHKDKDKKAGLNLIFWYGLDDSGNQLPTGKYKLEIKAEDSDKKSNTLSVSFEIVPATPNYHPEGKATFKDVPEKHWATRFIKVASDEKLISGYPDDTFKPDSFMPRYEVAVLALHTLGLNPDNENSQFTYNDSDKVPGWAQKYVSAALNKGLLSLFPDKKFYPERNISRAEIAAFVLKMINKQKINANISGVVVNEEESLNIDGNVIDLSKSKAFSLPLTKEYSEEVKVFVPELENMNVFNDEDYLPTEIKRN